MGFFVVVVVVFVVPVAFVHLPAFVVVVLGQQIGAQINPAYQILAGNVVFLAVLAFRSRGLFAVREVA